MIGRKGDGISNLGALMSKGLHRWSENSFDIIYANSRVYRFEPDSGSELKPSKSDIVSTSASNTGFTSFNRVEYSYYGVPIVKTQTDSNLSAAYGDCLHVWYPATNSVGCLTDKLIMLGQFLFDCQKQAYVTKIEHDRNYERFIPTEGKSYGIQENELYVICLDTIDNDNDGYFSSEDCDDLDSLINPGATEIVNSGIDENCDGYIAYDLDLDGYLDNVDCNDLDSLINPNVEEVIYDGLDNDCDDTTLDDDLDQDGYVLDEDCDDTNPNINPSATEIPNNGIDEDCDGSDLTTSVDDQQLSGVIISPNPFQESFTIVNESKNQLQYQLYTSQGKLVKKGILTKQLIVNIEEEAAGLYFLRVEDEQGGSKVFKLMKL